MTHSDVEIASNRWHLSWLLSAPNKLRRHTVGEVSSLPVAVAEPSTVDWHICYPDGTKPLERNHFHRRKSVPKDARSVQYTCKFIVDYKRI